MDSQRQFEGKALKPGSENIYLCQDGKYRWIYELNMYKNPAVIHVVFKIFFYIFLFVWVLMTVHSLWDGEGWETIWTDTQYLGIFCLVFSVLIIVAYLLVAMVNGGKYVVLFEMDEKGIVHRQLKPQVKKAKAMGWLTVMAGLASGRLSTVGAGILSATKTASSSSFDFVRSVKPYRKWHLIKVNEPFSKNQVYVEDEDIDFVYDYIVSRCPKLKTPLTIKKSNH